MSGGLRGRLCSVRFRLKSTGSTGFTSNSTALVMRRDLKQGCKEKGRG